jgi:rhodanese-related sulfurtransferase
MQEGYRYIDVRTEPEFTAGHPVGAVNVPVVFPDPATRQMQPNPDFLAVVEAHFPRHARLVIGCQSGMRSQRAAQILAEAGYSDVSNMAGGFGGARSPGGAVTPGWRDSGLPTESGLPADGGYDALRRKLGE